MMVLGHGARKKLPTLSVKKIGRGSSSENHILAATVFS
jgi:hypothetical protein